MINLDLDFYSNMNRIDCLMSPTSTSNNRISQGTSIEPLSRLTFSECDLYPSSVLP